MLDTRLRLVSNPKTSCSDNPNFFQGGKLKKVGLQSIRKTWKKSGLSKIWNVQTLKNLRWHHTNHFSGQRLEGQLTKLQKFPEISDKFCLSTRVSLQQITSPTNKQTNFPTLSWWRFHHITKQKSTLPKNTI